MLPIRRATIHDVDQLVQLRLRLFEEMRELAEPAKVREATRVYFTEALPQGTFLAWVAEHDQRIVASSGLVIFQRPPAPQNLSGEEAYILNMYTLPYWRGQGLATALLQEIIRYVHGTSMQRIWLHATESGRPIYEKAGFLAKHAEMELLW